MARPGFHPRASRPPPTNRFQPSFFGPVPRFVPQNLCRPPGAQNLRVDSWVDIVAFARTGRAALWWRLRSHPPEIFEVSDRLADVVGLGHPCLAVQIPLCLAHAELREPLALNPGQDGTSRAPSGYVSRSSARTRPARDQFGWRRRLPRNRFADIRTPATCAPTRRSSWPTPWR